MTDEELRIEIKKCGYWYHKIRLSPSVETPGWSPIDPSAYRIPDDLTGKRVLDVGSWDGFWAFQAAERGATSVLAIDDFSDTIGGDINADRTHAWRTFDLCRTVLGYDQCDRMEASIYDLCRPKMFDCVFCFGVLYHLRHPLLALEKMRSVCTGTIHIETAVLDNCRSMYGDYGYESSQCVAEFYPGNQYGQNHSNWHVGTLKYWMALVSAAGFTDVEGWLLTDQPKHLSECRGFIKASCS